MLDAGQMLSPVGLASNVPWAGHEGWPMSDKRVRVFSPEEMEKRRARSRRFYEANREDILTKLKTPEELAKKRLLAKARYHADPVVREKVKAYSAKWRAKPENKATIANYAVRYYASDKGRATKRAGLLMRYGLMPKQYEAKLAAQGGVCAICKQPETRLHRGNGPLLSLAVDHDHRCCQGKTSCGRCVRGLLCDRCNVGRFPDDPALLRAAADYFESYQGR